MTEVNSSHLFASLRGLTTFQRNISFLGQTCELISCFNHVIRLCQSVISACSFRLALEKNPEVESIGLLPLLRVLFASRSGSVHQEG
jgi:hypothetical protein